MKITMYWARGTFLRGSESSNDNENKNKKDYSISGLILGSPYICQVPSCCREYAD